MSDRLIIRLLAAICVALAAVTLLLAVLYARQSKHMACVEDWAEIGLVGRARDCS